MELGTATGGGVRLFDGSVCLTDSAPSKAPTLPPVRISMRQQRGRVALNAVNRFSIRRREVAVLVCPNQRGPDPTLFGTLSAQGR